MVILENIDIDIDKAILQNIDIDKISNRFKFGISNRAMWQTVSSWWQTLSSFIRTPQPPWGFCKLKSKPNLGNFLQNLLSSIMFTRVRSLFFLFLTPSSFFLNFFPQQRSPCSNQALAQRLRILEIADDEEPACSKNFHFS